MNSTRVLAIALAGLMSLPAMAIAEEGETQSDHAVHHSLRHDAHHRVHRLESQSAQSRPAEASAPHPAAPPSLFPGMITPYPENKGDENGMSDDPNDCNKGCIGGNPN